MSSKFKVIAIFTYPSEASALQARLDHEGIQSHLKDEHLIAAEPFASNALGGVKVQVFKEDFIRASAIVRELHPEQFAHEVHCTRCGSSRVHTRYTLHNFGKKLIASSSNLDYHCDRCGAQFRK